MLSFFVLFCFFFLFAENFYAVLRFQLNFVFYPSFSNWYSLIPYSRAGHIHAILVPLKIWVDFEADPFFLISHRLSAVCTMVQNSLILQYLIIHFPTSSEVSEGVTKQTNVHSARVRRAVCGKWMSEQVSEQTSEWLITYIWIFGCSEP